MKLRHPVVHAALGFLGSYVIRAVRPTLDCKALYFDPTVDTVHPRHAGRYVYAGWHEYSLLPVAFRGGPRLVALASRHADGDIIARIMAHLRWGVVRGSTSRGGVAALLQLLRDDQRNPSLTPDGPRGPRRRMALGPLYLAAKLGRPLVCLGYGYDRPWRLRSWDRFAFPRPFSRARVVFGPPLRLPPDADRPTLEAYRGWFERLLQWLTAEAEAWALDGEPRDGEMPLHPGQPARAMIEGFDAPALALPDDLAASWAALPHFPRHHDASGVPETVG